MFAINSLAGWWSIPWGLGAPFVLLQNIGALILPGDTSDLEAALIKAGIKLADIRLDEHGLTREQRFVIEGASQILATAIWADGVQKASELKRAVAILKQLTGDRIPETTLRQFIANGRKRADPLVGLPFELRQTLLVIALDVAMADGVLALAEIAVLYGVAERLGFGKGAVDALLGVDSRAGHSEPGSAHRGREARRNPGDAERAGTILGVSPDATLLEVRQAWRSAILRFHPDRAGTDKAKQGEYTTRSQEINWAYEVLRRSAEQTA